MQVSENSEITREFITYNHNDKVIGLAISGKILYTCTEYYMYAWLDRESRLLAMFSLPLAATRQDSSLIQTSAQTPLSTLCIYLQESPGQDTLEFIESNSDKTTYVFTPKAYYTIKNKEIESYVQAHFIPSSHVRQGTFAIEKSRDLWYYGAEEKIKIGEIPEKEMCTRIKYTNESVYLGMETGKIFKLDVHKKEGQRRGESKSEPSKSKERQEEAGISVSIMQAVYSAIRGTEQSISSSCANAQSKASAANRAEAQDRAAKPSADRRFEQMYSISFSTAYEGEALPILDFQITPMIISYFGRKLRTESLQYAEKEQVLSIFSAHSLFIVFTASHFLLLSETLHILYKDRVNNGNRGEGIFYSGRVFISQDSGILMELTISKQASVSQHPNPSKLAVSMTRPERASISSSE